MRRCLAALTAFLVFLCAAIPAGALTPQQRVLLLTNQKASQSVAVAYDPGGVMFWQEAGATLKSAGNFNGGTNTRHGIIAYRQMRWLGTPTTTTNGFRSSAGFGTYGNGAAGCSLEGCLGYMANADTASWSVAGVGFTLRNTLAGVDQIGGASPDPGTAVQGLNFAFDYTWQSVVSFYDTNAAAGSRKVVTFVDGVQITAPPVDTGIAFDMPWNTGRGVCINDCNHGSGIVTGGALMFADIIVDTTNALPAGCPATPANCQSVVDAFYKSSKPVNPGTGSGLCDKFRTSYSAASKTDWCLRGDKSHILLNTDGTANVMAVTDDVASTVRVLGTGAVLYNAPYGQNNEPTDRPFRAWASPVSVAAVTTTSTSSCTGAKCTSNVMGNFGGSIKTGDRIFVIWSNDYTTGPPSSTLPTLSAGWSFVASTTATNPTNDIGSSPRAAYLIATHVATADYVAANTDWVAGNAFADPLVITYDCIPHGACATAPRQITFVMLDYRSLNGVVNINASDMAAITSIGGANQNYAKAPSITTTKTVTTLMSFCTGRSTARPLNPPAGTDVATIDVFSGAGTPIITVGDEKLSAAGATGVRQYIESGTATTTDRAFCGQVALANS